MADSERLARVAADPRYLALTRRRGRFTWTLTCIMLVAYFGFILLIAFDKSLLAAPIGSGVTSIGIPVGLGVILLAIGLTGLYVRRANRDYDALVQSLVEGEGE
ncbi:DUF485 domain-containing protein [Sphingomonas sp. QA11]|uniref:DUF485 domain-containing protein n=1 Tax=Sphingomonas sp. QA11 TaxID=2950605 RepID=UPI0023497AEC|nr:DUF485 domain-containing protein [Sphingomonas sp. QA11]WCM27040.1 DUF485 domain-containing protein [Sphingomonas sp. QA11]